MTRVHAALAAAMTAALLITVPRAAGTLDIYFVDTEGGQATLLVTPARQALLIDSGYAGLDTNNPDKETGRDAARIAAAAKDAGIARIDVFLPTHFHGDHVGGVKELAARVPIDRFVDDGPSVQDSAPLQQKVGAYSEIYAAEFAKGRHLVVKPGDGIPLPGIDVRVIAANGRVDPAGGETNAHCGGIERRTAGNPEDTESIAIVVQFGRFRFANFGDLPWNQEIDLLCPENKAGRVDVYQPAGHGREPTPAVRAMAPRVAIASNGARKGAGAAALKGFSAMPGFEQLWLLHFSVAAGPEGNPGEAFIANLAEPGSGDEGRYLKLSALEDGSFTILNARTRAAVAYKARP
jgi:beta-lactamase superfamily II metal-dependent hydrolase